MWCTYTRLIQLGTSVRGCFFILFFFFCYETDLSVTLPCSSPRSRRLRTYKRCSPSAAISLFFLFDIFLHGPICPSVTRVSRLYLLHSAVSEGISPFYAPAYFGGRRRTEPKVSTNICLCVCTRPEKRTFLSVMKISCPVREAMAKSQRSS